MCDNTLYSINSCDPYIRVPLPYAYICRNLEIIRVLSTNQFIGDHYNIHSPKKVLMDDHNRRRQRCKYLWIVDTPVLSGGADEQMKIISTFMRIRVTLFLAQEHFKGRIFLSYHFFSIGSEFLCATAQLHFDWLGSSSSAT